MAAPMEYRKQMIGVVDTARLLIIICLASLLNLLYYYPNAHIYE